MKSGWWQTLKWSWMTRGIRVHHGGGKPGSGGPLVKMARFNQYFPECKKGFNIVYACYGFVPEDQCEEFKRKGVPIVYHMNSCWHPAYSDKWEIENKKFIKIHNEIADFIVYGSHYAREGALRYLGNPDVPYKLLYNGVDVSHFQPYHNQEVDRFNILIAGRHDIRHRIEPLIRAMPKLLVDFPHAKLKIAGELLPGEGFRNCSKDSFIALVKDLGMSLDRVEFIEKYNQKNAPNIYHQGDLLVHLKHMDWTPNVVAEAMACGLPIVHTGNGGLPELVGDAGFGLGLPIDWDNLREPNTDTLVSKIIEVWKDRELFGKKARLRAEREFDLEKWANEHRKIFKELLR